MVVVDGYGVLTRGELFFAITFLITFAQIYDEPFALLEGSAFCFGLTRV